MNGVSEGYVVSGGSLLTRMPRYFFNIVGDDRNIVDSQGVELADLEEVHQEAVTSARELMSGGVLRGQTPNGRRFVVTDEAGTVTAERSPSRTYGKVMMHSHTRFGSLHAGACLLLLMVEWLGD
jgi:hypothetical protein